MTTDHQRDVLESHRFADFVVVLRIRDSEMKGEDRRVIILTGICQISISDLSKNGVRAMQFNHVYSNRHIFSNSSVQSCETHESAHTAGGEIHDLERCKIGLHEDIDLEVFAPRHVLDELGRPRDKRLVFCTQLLIDDSSEACSKPRLNIGI